MQRLKQPYRGSVNLASGVYFPRTSREAFGHSMQREKSNRDWMWFVGSVVVLVIAAAVIVWIKKSS